MPLITLMVKGIEILCVQPLSILITVFIKKPPTVGGLQSCECDTVIVSAHVVPENKRRNRFLSAMRVKTLSAHGSRVN